MKEEKKRKEEEEEEAERQRKEEEEKRLEEEKQREKEEEERRLLEASTSSPDEDESMVVGSSLEDIEPWEDQEEETCTLTQRSAKRPRLCDSPSPSLLSSSSSLSLSFLSSSLLFSSSSRLNSLKIMRNIKKDIYSHSMSLSPVVFPSFLHARDDTFSLSSAELVHRSVLENSSNFISSLELDHFNCLLGATSSTGVVRIFNLKSLHTRYRYHSLSSSSRSPHSVSSSSLIESFHSPYTFSPITKFLWHPTNENVFAVSSNRSSDVYVYNMSAASFPSSPSISFKLPHHVRSLSFLQNPFNHALAMILNNNELKLFDLRTKKTQMNFNGRSRSSASSVSSFSPALLSLHHDGGNQLFTMRNDGQMEVWDCTMNRPEPKKSFNLLHHSLLRSSNSFLPHLPLVHCEWSKEVLGDVLIRFTSGLLMFINFFSFQFQLIHGSSESSLFTASHHSHHSIPQNCCFLHHTTALGGRRYEATMIGHAEMSLNTSTTQAVYEEILVTALETKQLRTSFTYAASNRLKNAISPPSPSLPCVSSVSAFDSHYYDEELHVNQRKYDDELEEEDKPEESTKTIESSHRLSRYSASLLSSVSVPDASFVSCMIGDTTKDCIVFGTTKNQIFLACANERKQWNQEEFDEEEEKRERQAETKDSKDIINSD